MKKYSFTCTCGDTSTVPADSLEDAAAKFKEMMTPEIVAKHMEENHPGEPVPSQEEMFALIDAGVMEEE